MLFWMITTLTTFLISVGKAQCKSLGKVMLINEKCNLVSFIQIALSFLEVTFAQLIAKNKKFITQFKFWIFKQNAGLTIFA